MKQNIRTKWFALTLTAALALTTLTACGNGAGTASLPETPGTSAPLLEESGGVAGTVLLSVNPEIEMDYDDLGNVVALTGRNQEAQTLLASYTGYEGRPCTQVVGELVDEINALGYFDATVGGHEKNIILKLERGSVYPNDQFLNELAEAVRLVVETDQIGSQAVTLGPRRLRRRLRGQGVHQAPPPLRASSPPSWAGTICSLWRRSTTWTTGSTRWNSSWTAWSTSMR